MRGRLRAAVAAVEGQLLDLERARGAVGAWTVSANRFRAEDNRTWWNTHDWSARGEEWTPSLEWKSAVIERFLLPHVPSGGATLEIGPGGGRWTEVLRERADRLYLLDVAERPLAVCRERFAGASNIEYMLGDGRTVALPDASLDAIWSYDVFVHVNPNDARSYFEEFARLLRPGAFAVIHHPGHTSTSERQNAHRSDLTDQMVLDFAAETGLEVVLQTTDLVNVGDALTVLRKGLRPTFTRQLSRGTGVVHPN